MTKSHIFILLLAGLLGFTPAVGQLSKMEDVMRNFRSHGDALHDLARDPVDEEKVYKLALTLRDTARNGVAVFAEFGAPLAAAASSPYEQQLREPAKISTEISLWIRELEKKCDTLLKRIEYRERDQIKGEALGAAIHARKLSEDWPSSRRKFEDTLRWLYESLQAAHAMRNDSSKSAGTIDAAMRQLDTKYREQAAEVDRCYEQWRACRNRAAEAARRYDDAQKAYEAAVQAPPGSSYESNVNATFQRWVAAHRDYREAYKQVYEADAVFDRANAEADSRAVQIARLMNDLETFQRNANPETIAKRVADFDRWTKIFERELSR